MAVNLIRNSVQIIILGVSFLSLISLFTLKFSFHWLFEIIANLQVYYLIFHVIAVFVLIILRQKIIKKYTLLLLMQLFFVFNTGRVVLPFYYSPNQNVQNDAAKNLSVYYANVFSANNNISSVREQINKADPDLVGLLEINQRWSDGLNLKGKYPYYFEALREDNFGLSVYSKYRLGEEPVIDFGDEMQPAYFGNIDFQGRKIFFSLIHLLPPLSNEALYRNRLLLRRLSSMVRFRKDPYLLMGDFNSTPFSSYYRKFIEWTDLKNVFFGQGFIGTWNARRPLIRLNIDHILYKNLYAGKAEVLPDIGSDHYAILSNFNP